MTYLGAFLVVLSAMAVAAVTSLVAAIRLPIERRQRHHEVGAAVFGQVGVMLSILMAFVFSDVWTEYRTAAQAINAECASLHGAAVLASSLPNREGAGVISALDRYSRAVVTQEWTAMNQRHRSQEASAGITGTLREVARLKLADPSDSLVKSQILSLVTEAHSARETRIFEMTQGLPPFLWWMLMVLSGVLVLFVALAGLENPGRVMFTAIFAGSIALVLVVVRMLDFPFEGALALPSTDFARLVGQLDVLARIAPS